MFFLLALTVCFLAWSNGANDTFKGVASLYGSGAAGYRTALVWGTLSTAAGSAEAILWRPGWWENFPARG